MRKLCVLLLLLCAASGAWASNDWLTSAATNDWFTSTNWSSGIVPSSTSVTNVRTYQTHFNTIVGGPVIADGDATAYQVEVGGDSHATGGVTGTLTINSGSLTITDYFRSGASSTSNRWGKIYINGDDTVVTVGGPFTVGWGSSTVDVEGWLYMTGGTVTVNNAFNIANAVGASGFAYVSGGTITANSFAMNVAGGTHTGTPLLALSGTGEVIIAGDITGTLAGYFANGWITGATYDYNITTPGKTTIYVPEPATVCLLGLGALSLLRRKR
jgi:hypothetical protein